MSQRQRTIQREVSIRGKTLHLGEDVQLTFKPAPADSGVVFKRVDLFGKPEIKPGIEMVSDLVRSTTITAGHAKISTVEHVLSALSGMGVDNVVVELDGNEPPILDGSAKHFVNLLQEAEPVDQEKDRDVFELKEPVSVTEGNRSIIALPYDGLKITCTSADDRGFHTQHLSLDIDPQSYITDIAPSRTFTIYEDIEELLKMGKIRGGSLDSAIVIRGDKILSKEPLRFKDEFVRHKMLDILGDIALLGKGLKAHIIAVRPGHALNAKLTAAIAEQMHRYSKGYKKPKKPLEPAILPTETSVGIQKLLTLLPHRYPFVMVDRVTEIKSDDELVAIKNVTINEPYFQGHFPGKPVMPGVLQIEAMAQAAGLLMLTRYSAEDKITYFMSCDKVKFRRAVEPGDQLVIFVKMNKIKESRVGQIASATARCEVGGKVVSSAELLFTIMEAGEDA